MKDNLSKWRWKMEELKDNKHHHINIKILNHIWHHRNKEKDFGVSHINNIQNYIEFYRKNNLIIRAKLREYCL